MRRARPDTPRDHRLRRRHAPYASLCQPSPPTVAAIRDIGAQVRRTGVNVNRIAHNVNREMHASERDEATAARTVRQRRKLISRPAVIITQADRK